MRRDVVELRRFYASPLGAAAREMMARKIDEAWDDLHGLDVLALGYATPFLDDRRERARRVVAAMPSGQGVEIWPGGGRNLACLADENALPFPNALFDRVLMVHALEEAADPLSLLREAWRVLAPTGRLIIVAAARGLWSNAEQTPFGHGRPYTRHQLEELVRDAELEPTAWSRALYVPPAPWLAPYAGVFEQVGARLWPRLSGLILLETVKQTFAVKPRGHAAKVLSPIPVVARPLAAGRDGRTVAAQSPSSSPPPGVGGAAQSS